MSDDISVRMRETRRRAAVRAMQRLQESEPELVEEVLLELGLTPDVGINTGLASSGIRRPRDTSEETKEVVSQTSGEMEEDDGGMGEAELGVHAIQGEGQDIGGGSPSGRPGSNEVGAEGKEETTVDRAEGKQERTTSSIMGEDSGTELTERRDGESRTGGMGRTGHGGRASFADPLATVRVSGGVEVEENYGQKEAFQNEENHNRHTNVANTRNEESHDRRAGVISTPSGQVTAGQNMAPVRGASAMFQTSFWDGHHVGRNDLLYNDGGGPRNIGPGTTRRNDGGQAFASNTPEQVVRGIQSGQRPQEAAVLHRPRAGRIRHPGPFYRTFTFTVWQAAYMESEEVGISAARQKLGTDKALAFSDLGMENLSTTTRKSTS